MTEHTEHKLEMMDLREKVRDMALQLDTANERLLYCENKMKQKDLTINNCQHRLNNISNIIDDVEFESINENIVYTFNELKEPWSWFSKIKREANGE